MPRALVGGIPEFNGINYKQDGQTIEDIDSSRVLNLFNLGGVDDQEIKRRIEGVLQRDIKSPETLLYIREVYKKALLFYKETLLIDIKEPFLSQKFHTIDDLVRFLKLTASSKNKERRQIYCDLVKIMFCYNEIEKNPQMKNAEKNTREFIAHNYLENESISIGDFKFNMASLMQKKENEDYYETEGHYFRKIQGGGYKKIQCTLRFRGKSPEKMVVKILGSEKGSSKAIDIIRDSIGIELEAENKDESIYLLEYLYYVHKERGEIEQTEFRQKPGFYTEDDIERYSQNSELSEEFRGYLKEKLTNLKKPHGSIKYQDCKFQGIVDLGDGVFNGCESRVVLKGNKNQSGLSASGIIDGKKIIEAVIGLRGWVSRSYVSRIVDNVVKDTKILKNSSVIMSEYLQSLIKVPVPKLDRNIFSSQRRLEDIIKNASEYPDFIINAIKKKIGGTVSSEEIIKKAKEGMLGVLLT